MKLTIEDLKSRDYMGVRVASVRRLINALGMISRISARSAFAIISPAAIVLNRSIIERRERSRSCSPQTGHYPRFPCGVCKSMLIRSQFVELGDRRIPRPQNVTPCVIFR